MLLAWFFGQAISVSDRVGVTADEPIHLTAGYSYWTTDDYRLQPENGNFPQRWAALPLLLMGVHPVPPNHDVWQRADSWGTAHAFLFHLGNQPYLLVFAGRCMIALLGVITGCLVFVAARAWFGPPGGVLATAVFASSPSLLAHGALVTSDIAAGLGFLLCTLTGWRLLHRLTVGRSLSFGFALGLLALAKFSAGLFAFVWVGVFASRVWRASPLPVRFGSWRRWLRGRVPQVFALGTAHAAAVLVALLCIWGAYGFRFQATPGPTPTPVSVPWEVLLGEVPFRIGTPVPEGVARTDLVPVQPTFVRAAVRWARNHRLLPEAYLYGFSHVYTYSKWRPSFFAGEYRVTGWWNYFPTLYLLKTPLPLLALNLLAAVTLLRLARHTLAAGRLGYRLVPILFFIGVYLAFAVGGNLNIGHRHLLPAEVMGCVLVGILARDWVVARPWRRVVLVALVAASGLVAWRARPGYLSYFNELGGGPNQAYRLFVDSAIDWGQGLPALADWLAKDSPAAGNPVYLAYFGSDSPPYAGVRARRIGDAFFDRDRKSFAGVLAPGTYVVSATLLQGVYTLVPGPWRPDYEKRYQQMLAEFLRSDPHLLPATFWSEWDQVRFGRLAHYLCRRAPDAQPDPSLLVYRLSQDELVRALFGPP